MGFIASAFLVVFSLVAAVIPSIAVPGVGEGEEPLFPAPPGYLLPWAGGQLHDVTQGEETSTTHNGLAAYAFDFGLNYDNVVAARSGRVAMVYDWSNQSGCDPTLAIASNYVVIDHGDGTSALYLHLSYDSAIVATGDLVARGQVIGLSGDTGLTCANDDDEQGGASAPHLHFQVQKTEGSRYFTQSMPVAFDDVKSNDGVPLEGETLVSGNYGRGKPQKIKLTAYRSQRVFSPKATPADPSLTERHETPTPEGAPTETSAISETPTPGASDTPSASDTPQPTTTRTPSDTPAPDPTPSVDSPTPSASDTPTPAPSNTPEPQPSDTPPAAQGGATEPRADATEPPGEATP